MATTSRNEKHVGGQQTRISLLMLVVVGLLAVCYMWTARWMVQRWEAPQSYYSHGWLIPPIAGFLLWLNRKELARCEFRPTMWGLIPLALGLIMQAASVSWQIGFLSGFSLFPVIAGLVLMLHGGRLLRAVAFPLAILVFMIPLPSVSMQKVSFEMKMLAARVSAWLLNLGGIVVVRRGSFLDLPTGTLIVDNVCSGLKYLISLTAFGALYAYFSRLRLPGKVFLFLLAVPLAVAANIARILLMMVVAHMWGTDAAQKWYSHDVLGFALFVVAFMLYFGVESVAILVRPSLVIEKDSS